MLEDGFAESSSLACRLDGRAGFMRLPCFGRRVIRHVENINLFSVAKAMLYFP